MSRAAAHFSLSNDPLPFSCGMPSRFGNYIDVGSGNCVGQANLGYHPIMGLREQTDSYFGRRVRAERERREWSQEELAKRLTDKGIDTYASTIAKIESERKPRAVRLAEATAIADLFEVSLDTLLGRSVPKHDEMYAFKALLDTANKASWQVSTIEATLRDRAAELATFDLAGWLKAFQSRCERACDALAEANDALQAAMNPPGSEDIQRLTRQQLFEELQKEMADEAQS
jgi:transcriptional regulator with XRE-family HTH domain